MTDLQPARGTHDLIGEDQRRYHHVAETARRIAATYGFDEWITPIFEDTRVFSRTLGETSDVVMKEMYTFDDRGGESVTLRPEGTAGVCRALVTNGLTQSYALNLSGGTPKMRYFVSGNGDHDQGVEPNNLFKRYGARANLTITPNDKIDVTTSLGYSKGHTDLSLEAGGGGAMWETLFSTPQNLGTTAKGFRDYPPGINYAAISDWQDVNRFTGSVQINHHPTSWLVQRLVIGTDVTSASASAPITAPAST